MDAMQSLNTVSQAYRDLFGKSGDAEGIKYWTNQLRNGELNPDDLKIAMASSAVDEYGYSWDPNARLYTDGQSNVSGGGGGGGGGGGADIFQSDLYPKSESNSTSTSTSTSASRSGLEDKYIDQIMGATVPELTKSISGLSDAPNQYAQNAIEKGNASGKEALKFAGQNVLESMANRNMINSSVAGDAMGNAIGGVAKNTQNLGYQAGMDEANMKMSVPQILASLASLGNVSQASGVSSSTSDSNSLSEQPNVPYQNAMNFILGMMG